MKTIQALALVTVGIAFLDGAPLAAADGLSALSSNRPPARKLTHDAVGKSTSVQANEPASRRFQDEFGARLGPQAGPEAPAQAATISSPRTELRARRPDNVVQSLKHPGIEYSGILVQWVRSNPLHLINPLAPSRYGDGDANTVHNLITGRSEGLKVLAINF